MQDHTVHIGATKLLQGDCKGHVDSEEIQEQVRRCYEENMEGGKEFYSFGAAILSSFSPGSWRDRGLWTLTLWHRRGYHGGHCGNVLGIFVRQFGRLCKLSGVVVLRLKTIYVFLDAVHLNVTTWHRE